MTRKHYIKAAEIVKNKREAARDTNRVISGSSRIYEENFATELEETFIQFFRDDNPRFDSNRFSEACHSTIESLV